MLTLIYDLHNSRVNVVCDVGRLDFEGFPGCDLSSCVVNSKPTPRILNDFKPEKKSQS